MVDSTHSGTRDRPVASDFENALHRQNAVGAPLDSGPTTTATSTATQSATPPATQSAPPPAASAAGAPIGTHAAAGDDGTRETPPRTLDEPPASVAGARVMHREPYRPRFSLGATFFGWACATFFSLVFITLLAIALSGQAMADGTLGTNDVGSLGVVGIVGVLLAAFVAYLLGGYVAGRMAAWRGALHGGLTVAWALLATALLVGLGAYAGNAFGLFGAIPAWLDLSALTTGTILFLVGHLVAMLAGGILGGQLGERYFGRHFNGDDRAVSRRRLGSTRRGRPL